MIYEDKSLAQEIEQYLKKREALDQIKRDKEEAKAKGLDYVEINDKDFEQDFERIAKEKEQDRLLYEGEEEDEWA